MQNNRHQSQNIAKSIGCDWDSINTTIIAPRGFREYDGRWLFPEELNLLGAIALGEGLGTLMHEHGVKPQIVLGCDFRSYSQSVANALTIGLIRAGIEVHDIGTVLSPMAYFGRVHLGVDSVAMITASHNPNGWTGLKAGLRHPLTLCESDMKRLKEIVLKREFIHRPNGSHQRVVEIEDAYAADICREVKVKRHLKVVCAAGNGTAGQFAPSILKRIGLDVQTLHTEPNACFPNYNPNPESIKMLEDIGRKVRDCGADLGLGFDGDGDRLGVVDEQGQAIFSDKIGLLLARSIAGLIPNAKFIADIKSTGLFSVDTELRRLGGSIEYWKTGHSHMKARLDQTKATAGFEKSGHFYFGSPIGHGYDDALLAAIELCRGLDIASPEPLSVLANTLPNSWMTPTMSPFCSDEEKYAVVARITEHLDELAARGTELGGQRIVSINKINGARCQLANGSWALVRASSNTPSLVVVCESMANEIEMRAIFADFDRLIRQDEEAIGEYDQQI